MGKLKPILFSTSMVQAILEGRKTQTRRIIKSKHESGLFEVCSRKSDGQITGLTSLDWDERPKNDCTNDIQPLAKVGDILWVRETWFPTRYDFKELLQSGITSLSKGNIIKYKADNDYDPKKDCVGRSWKPSIFMPKEACRIFLEVTDVRVERLQDISGYDIISEGLGKKLPVARSMTQASIDYRSALPGLMKKWKYLWQSINGKESWKQNPWVWVYDFKRVERPENFIQ